MTFPIESISAANTANIPASFILLPLKKLAMNKGHYLRSKRRTGFARKY